MDSSNLQVRWKHHQMGVIDYLRQLLVSEVFVDVTLCCQNKRFKAHRILLSACSSYLQQVLVEHLGSDHITIILPDIHHEDMQWLLDFMYTGSVAVPRCRLASFLQAAETLHIKVLTDMAQLQKATDSDVITCVPASSLSLDVILSDQQKFPKQILNSNLKSQDIKEDNLNENVKITFCNTETNTTTERTRLEQFKPNKSEFKSATEDRNSCMFKSSVNNSCVPRCYQNYTESNSVTCNSTLNASSPCAGLTKGTEQRDANEEEKISGVQVCSSEGAAVRNSSCNTKIIHNTVKENNKSVGCTSDNAVVPYLDNPLLSKGCDNKDAVENLNNNQNAKSIPINHNEKLLKPSQINRSCSNSRIGISREVSSPIDYGFQPHSANNLHINQKGNNVTAHNFNSAYRKDIRLSHELSLVSQHSSQLDNPEYYSQYLQRLSQWPKPLPSLMPISNNNYHFNGQIAAHNFTKDDRFNGVLSNQQIKDPQPTGRLVTLPEHLKSANDMISNVQSNYQNCNSVSTAQNLKENKCFKNAWFPSRDKLIHVNGQRPMADCRFSSKKLSQIVPRLSPIVPPSPWAQNHQPPCAAPVVCPPRTGSIELSYQHSKWMALKQATHQAQNFTSQGEMNQHTSLSTSSGLQHLADHGRPPSSAPVPNVSPVRNLARSPSPQSKQLKRPANNVTELDQAAWIRKRTSENMEAFCRLKERRLHDFYKEQMSMRSRTAGNEYQEKEEEAASDLSTKSSQSPVRSPHSNSARSSPSDYPKSATPSTASLQQKVSSAEFCAPKLAACNDSLYKDVNKEEESTKLSKNCDIDGSDVGIIRQVNSTINEDKMLHNTDIKNCESEQDCDSQNYVTADDDVQILKEERLTVLIKNDSNNNNGVIDDSAQMAPAVKSHGCEDCGKFFSRRQLLVQHRRIHTGERPYSCADCGRQFTQRGHWSTHQKLHEPARRPEHACPSCGKAFVTRASLKVHLRTHTGEKPFQCGECGKQFSQLRNYKYHRSVHEGTREFAATCPECGKYFNDRGYLSSHMKIHRNRKEYGCQYCGKSFNQRVAYNMHVRIHTGERPHSCPHCNKSFSRKMLLKQHLRIHTGEKPFACSVCGKAFADRSNMTLHMRLHSGIKPYSCQLCAKAFTKKHHLKTHLNYHTGTKPYSCSKCGLRFSQSSNMRTHYKKCTSTEPMKVETPVIKTEDTKQLVEEGNGVTPPSSSPSGSVTSPSSSAAVITPPHSDESSCGSSVIPRNPIEAQPA